MSTPYDNLNFSIHRVSLKRTREACGPCRRKKARCPGEKPICSHCQRLGQACSYGSQTENSGVNKNHYRFAGEGRSRSPSAPDQQSEAGSRRLQHIEQRLEEISSLLQERLPPPDGLLENPSHPQPAGDAVVRAGPQSPGHGLQPNAHYASSSSPLPNSLVEQEVGVYLTEFHDQPYCVFEKSWLLRNQSTLPPEIKYALIAMTRGRSADSPGMPDQDVSARTFCIEQAWQILSKKYLEGNTDLAFLQGTFLIAQLDFADGNSQRGSASVGLALRVIQSHGLNRGTGLSHDPDSEAKRRITWAYFMLDRTYNASRSYSLCLSDTQFTLQFPSTSTDRTDRLTVRGSLHESATGQGSKVDQGILACLLRLYSLWGKATEWVFEPLPTSSLPPWQSGSALAILESEWMQFETQFADEHRYMNVEFKRRAREDPDSRPYLSTWLCVQFLFHSTQCLLHHPFVTMVKLRHLNGNLSATFLQKSFETSLLHSRWIARFIREMAEVDFKLCDPFFGYLAAIAATIQLEHTGNKNPKIALLLNDEYSVLVNFIKGLSSQWDSMRVLLARLNELASRHQNYGSLFYNQDGFSGELSNMATPSNLPRMSTEDEALMWNILDLTSFSGPEAEPSTETVTRGTSWYETVLESDSAPAPAPQPTSMHHGESLAVSATPEWSLSPRPNYALPIGVPDIPDWMIFGDFMNEHL